MNKIISLATVFSFCIFILASCHSSNLTDVKTTPEMEEFMKAMNGHYDSVTKALAKFSVKSDLPTADMDLKDLRDPVITEASVKDGITCYTVKTNDGAKDCFYELCWQSGKIISITDKTPE